MPAEFLNPLAGLLSWVATYFLHSTVLLAGAWIWLRLRPTTGHAARETLWKLALIGGVITTPAQCLIGVSGPVGELVLGESVRPAEVNGTDPDSNSSRTATELKTELHSPHLHDARSLNEMGAATATDGLFLIAVESDGLPEEAGGSWGADRPAGSLLTRAAASDAAGTLSARGARGWDWACGGIGIIAAASMLFGMARCAAQSACLRRRLLGARRIERGRARGFLDELCLAVPGTPCVRLLATPECAEPAAFGLWRWTIVLPERAERDLTDDELHALLAHELAHLVRGDNWWLLVSRLVCSGGGFQPLNHLARREWQRAAEHLCDAWAVSRTGSPLALARCLTEVAGWRWTHANCAASLAATGRRSGLSDRIERLLASEPLADPWHESRSRQRRLLLGGLVLAVWIGCGPRISLLTDAAEKPSPSSSSALQDDSSQSGDRSVAVEAQRELTSGVSSGPTSELVGLPLVPAESGSAGERNTTALLWSLDSELSALSRELDGLRPLLEQAVPHRDQKEGARLLERMRAEFERLEARRGALARLLATERTRSVATGGD